MRNLRQLFEVMDGRTATAKYEAQLIAALGHIVPHYVRNQGSMVTLLATMDPTTRTNPEGEITRLGSYSEWLFNRMLDTRGESLDTQRYLIQHPQLLTLCLAAFEKHRSSLPVEQRNIQSYKSIKDFLAVASPLLQKDQERHAQKAATQTTIEHKDYVEVPANPGWRIYIPLTSAKAKSLGARTHWCTAGSTNGRQYYKEYAVDENSALFILIPDDPEAERWQTHLGAGRSVEGFNAGSNDHRASGATEDRIRQESGLSIELQRELTDKYCDQVSENYKSGMTTVIERGANMAYVQLLLKLMMYPEVLRSWGMEIKGNFITPRNFSKLSPADQLEHSSQVELVVSRGMDLFDSARGDLYSAIETARNRKTAEIFSRLKSYDDARDDIIEDIVAEQNYPDSGDYLKAICDYYEEHGRAVDSPESLSYRQRQQASSASYFTALFLYAPRSMYTLFFSEPGEARNPEEVPIHEVRKGITALLKSAETNKDLREQMGQKVKSGWEDRHEWEAEGEDLDVVESFFDDLSVDVKRSVAIDYIDQREDYEADMGDPLIIPSIEKVAQIHPHSGAYVVPPTCKAVAELNQADLSTSLSLNIIKPAYFWLDSQGAPEFLDLENMDSSFELEYGALDHVDYDYEMFERFEDSYKTTERGYRGCIAQMQELKSIDEMFNEQERQDRRRAREFQPELDLGLPESRRRR